MSASLTVEVGSSRGGDSDQVALLGDTGDGVPQVQPLTPDPVRQQLTDLLRPSLKQCQRAYRKASVMHCRCERLHSINGYSIFHPVYICKVNSAGKFVEN